MSGFLNYPRFSEARIGIVFLICALTMAGCGGSSGKKAARQPHAAGYIDRFEIVSIADAFGGDLAAGTTTPYTVITGIAHGKLKQDHPDNTGIVDLDKAPADADGFVSYSTDVVILRPKTAAAGQRVLFYEAVNRGIKLAQVLFVGNGSMFDLAHGGSTDAPAPDGTIPSLVARGYTIVWSGWQGDIAQTGAGSNSPLGAQLPIAKNADGSSITGLTREEFISDSATTQFKLSYAPASLTDKSEVIFTARQSWLDANGKADYAVPSAAVATWNYVTNSDGSVSVQFTPPASVPVAGGGTVAPDAGTIYSFVYRAKDPKVMGIGYAAIRDLVTFLKNDGADAQGNTNPLADMKNAQCVLQANCSTNPTANFDVVIGEGISQPGRLFREFVRQGFNKDSDGNKVFDGVMSIISGGRGLWLNHRFSQPARSPREHEDHWAPSDSFPFAYSVTTDPITGATDGLLKSCENSGTCPKIMQIDGSFEWWGGRASLVVTDGNGHDLTLPDNVRYYLIADTQHFGGFLTLDAVTTGLVTQPPASSQCQFAKDPVAEGPVFRALASSLEAWIARGTPPPPSRYPSVAAGTAVLPNAAAMGFPDLSSVSVPNGPAATPLSLSLPGVGRINQLSVTDYSSAEPVADLNRGYTMLVPKVDANGNETSGIRMPEVVAPLGTYLGWNLRGAGFSAGESCAFYGSAIPFATTPGSKAAGDPRATLSDLYNGRADYLAKFGAAADGLVNSGYMIDIDAAAMKTSAAAISPALISAP